MQNKDELIHQPSEQNTRLIEENRWLKERLDITLNTLALQQEEIQRLKDEIAILKGQKPHPKIPPSILEGAKSKDKQNRKNQPSRGKHPRRKKTGLKIHARNRIINEGTADYIESLKPSYWLKGYLALHGKDRSMHKGDWEAFLEEINIKLVAPIS